MDPKIDLKSLLKKDNSPPPMHSAWYDLPSKLPQPVRGTVWKVPENVKLPAGSKIQFSTRSPYAVYLYLGRWLKVSATPQFFFTIPPDAGLITVLGDQSINCFTQLSYQGQHYCVPQEAYNTKRIFAILHQIAGLNIAHASTPPTLSVRTVP